MTAIATLIGRLTRDPETTTTMKNGEELSLTKFSIAVDDSFGKDSTTSFFDLVAWNGLGTNLAAHKSKGDQIAVVCRPKQNRWQQDGQNRQKVEFIAEKIEFLGSRSTTVADEVPAAVQAESAPTAAPAPAAPELSETQTEAVEAINTPAEDQMAVPF